MMSYMHCAVFSLDGHSARLFCRRKVRRGPSKRGAASRALSAHAGPTEITWGKVTPAGASLPAEVEGAIHHGVSDSAAHCTGSRRTEELEKLYADGLLQTIVKYSRGPSFATFGQLRAQILGARFRLRGTMKARHLIESSSYGPAKLHVIFEAFDQAWAEIAGNFGEDARDVEGGRERLAHAILAVAEEGDDPASLKDAALQQMALDYGERS
jgi:hypothetical protein